MIVANRLTDEDKKFLLGKGYWNEKDMRSCPELHWYQITDTRYIPVICAEDWFNFRLNKTGNLVKDFEWWVTEAKAKYGIFPSDLEYIKAQRCTYESAEDYPDTKVREFIRWMKEA